MPLKKIAIINYKAYKKTIENLISKGYQVILTYPFFKGKSSISSHADLQVFPFEEFVVVAPNISLKTLKPILRLYNKNNLLFGKNFLKDKYPFDVSYNAIVVNKYIFGNRKYIDPIIIDISKRKNISFVHVNQGYVRCTTLPVGENTLITHDKGILKKAKKLGINTLYLDPGYVKLEEYSYGFLPGAVGIDNNIIYINGDIDLYPYRHKLQKFLEKNEIKIKSLSPGNEVEDIGSILFL